MAGNSDKLRTWAVEVLRQHHITSSHQAELATDGVLSYSTFNKLMTGRKVSANSIKVFAKYFNVSPNPGLNACGYLGLPEEDENEGSAPDATGGSPEPVEEREPFYDDLPPELRKVVGWHAKVINALPPGKQRDMYVASLEAQAEANWALIEQREKEEEQSR